MKTQRLSRVPRRKQEAGADAGAPRAEAVRRSVRRLGRCALGPLREQTLFFADESRGVACCARVTLLDDPKADGFNAFCLTCAEEFLCARGRRKNTRARLLLSLDAPSTLPDARLSLTLECEHRGRTRRRCAHFAVDSSDFSLRRVRGLTKSAENSIL